MRPTLGVLALLAAVGSGVVGAAQVTDVPGIPCVACQALSVTPEQVAVIPEHLNGARILVRVAAGTPAPDWTSALAKLGRRGARAGVHLTSVPPETDPALAAPVDELAIDVAGGGDPDQVAFDLKRALTRARGERPNAGLIVLSDAGTREALLGRGLRTYADEFLPPAGTIESPADLLLTRLAPTETTRIWRLSLTPESARAIADAAAALQSWFPAGLVPVAGRTLACGEDHPLHPLLNPQTLDLVAVSASCPASAAVTSDMRGAVADRIDAGAVSAFRVRAAGTNQGFATGVDVAAARALTVEEIIARHQAAAARQAAEIKSEIAIGSLTLTFEAPGFVAPLTITSETTIYTIGGRTDLSQRNIRVNGVLFPTSGGVPRLPIIEPERAAAPPLAITLSDLYRYRLAGRESLAGRDCYLVAFAPRDRRAALYDGRVWIDASTFGMVRVSAAQTGLKGPITASEQTDDFSPDASGRWLLARSSVHQNYEGAAVRTPIHRLLLIDRHEVNPPDFIARRAAAYGSTDVMLRDTPAGYRYLKNAGGKRQESGAETGHEAGKEGVESAERVIAGRASRVRTLAFGVIVDPNITQPLPFAGLSYVDFDLFGTGAQFNGFFGGSYGQLAFSAPSLRGTRWQLAGRAFGIASSYNDRAFEAGREQYVLDIRQRPAQAAVWFLRPLSARAAVRLEYDWDYTRFGRAPETSPAFVVPRNQNAHALRLGLDLQRAGWQASLWGSYARRIGWRAWGLPGSSDYSPAHADFERYGATLFRSQSLSPRLTGRIEFAAMSGRDLDRFSRYAFGTFDNRLHGYPAALIRYDRGAVVRTAIAWSASRFLRLDGFADSAAVHDPGFSSNLRRYTGLGAALEAPAPFGTLLSLEWGFGLQGIDTNGRQGTHVVRISGYKVF
ncbi:MAG TPA: sigma-E factor regulatory protein RseB domain-containing protein [Vicinamibacterales bacterium]|nr:sigma-E factor regulatory protein RseB domain-containing protein [Vicinamibacterales bacterium]